MSQPSFTAPFEPGRAKISVPPATIAQARDCTVEVPLEQVRKLTRFPMQLVWGDNIEKSETYRARCCFASCAVVIGVTWSGSP